MADKTPPVLIPKPAQPVVAQPAPVVAQPAQPAQPQSNTFEAQSGWQFTQPGQFTRHELGKGNITVMPTPQRGYWEDPKNVAKYYNFLQSASPNWQAPDWLPRQEIEDAYKWMEYKNGGFSWTNWSPLSENDPATATLRALPPPPNQYLTPDESIYAAPEPAATTPTPQEPALWANIPQGDWDATPLWMKIAMTLMSPSPMQGRPEWNRVAAAGIQGLTAAIGTAAIGGAIGNVPGAVVGGLAGLGEGFYRSYTGNTIPGLSDLMQVFNIPAQWLEQGLGVGNQAITEGLDTVLANLPAAWKAGQMQYEVMNQDILNLMAIAAGDQAAKPGEVWNFSQGYLEPVPLLNQTRTGQGPRAEAALQEARERVAGGEDPFTVYADFYQRFGDTGTFNDFVLQTVLDPTQLAPLIGGKIGEGAARIFGNEALARVFKEGQGSIIADVTPFGLKWVPKIFGLHESDGLVNSLKTYGEFIRTGSMPAGWVGEDIARQEGDYTWLDRKLGGLTKEGTIAELAPNTGDNKTGWLRSLSKLTPDSQASIFLSNFTDQLNTLVLAATDDPNLSNADKVQLTAKLINQYAGISPAAVGDFGKQIIGSPMTSTTAVAAADFVKSGKLQNMMLEFIGDQDAIEELNSMAGLLQAHPAKLIEDIGNDPKKVLKLVLNAADKAGNDPYAMKIRQAFDAGTFTPETLLDSFSQFIGEKKGTKGKETIPGHAWSYYDWYARVMSAVMDHSTRFLTDYYGIKPNGVFMKLADVLKAVQSLFLLDYNPAYMVNNAIGNKVAMAAQGVTGFMTSGQREAWIDRFGIYPSRLKEGFTPAGVGDESSGYGKYISSIRKDMVGTDTLGKIYTQIKDFRGKFGVFSKLSGNIEAADSSMAYTVGMQKMWNKLWKEDTGFRKMDTRLEDTLTRAGLDPKRIYDTIKDNLNMEEIQKDLYQDVVKINISRAIEESAKQIDPVHADMISELFRTTGIEQALGELLKDNPTPQSNKRSFKIVQGKFQDMIQEKEINDLAYVPDEVKIKVQNEGIQGALDLFKNVQLKIWQRWMSHLQNIDEMLNNTLTTNPETINDAWVKTNTAETQKWTATQAHELEVYSSILNTLGIDNQAGRELLGAFSEAHKSWRDAFNGYDVRVDNSQRITLAEARKLGMETVHIDGTQDIYRKFFKTKFDPKNNNARTEAWGKTRKEVTALMEKAKGTETILNERTANLFADLFSQQGGDQNAALAWRKKVNEIRSRMMDANTKFYQKLSQAKDQEARAKLKAEYWRKTYPALINEYEGYILKGAQELTNQKNDVSQPANPTTETVVEPQSKTAQQQAVEQVQAMVAKENLNREADASRDTIKTIKSRNDVLNTLQDQFHLKPEERQVIGTLIDLYAERWAQRTGKNASEWFGRFANEGENSNGLMQMGDISTPAFKNWFGDSKVVDKNRNPLVVYHGGGNKIDSFTKTSSRGNLGIAYFTDNPEVASKYAIGGGISNDIEVYDTPYINNERAPQVTPVYLSINNLLNLDDITFKSIINTLGADYVINEIRDWLGNTYDKWVDEYKYDGIDDPEQSIKNNLQYLLERDINLNALSGQEDTLSLSKSIPALFLHSTSLLNDYEIKNHTDGIVYYDNEAGGNTYVIKKPSQAKSIFDPNILNQLPQSLRELANQYGVPTATEKGNPNDRNVLNIINKYKPDGEKFTSLNDVSTDVAGKAFAAWREAKGKEPVFVAKGSTQFLADGRAMIKAFKGADMSTLVHELAHVFRRDLGMSEIDEIAKYGGLNDGAELTNLAQLFQDNSLKQGDANYDRYVQAEEKFSRGFEKWLAEGDALIPPKLASVFQKLKQWLLDVYKKITGTSIDVELTEPVRNIFRKMLFDESDIIDTGWEKTADNLSEPDSGIVVESALEKAEPLPLPEQLPQEQPQAIPSQPQEPSQTVPVYEIAQDSGATGKFGFTKKQTTEILAVLEQHVNNTIGMDIVGDPIKWAETDQLRNNPIEIVLGNSKLTVKSPTAAAILYYRLSGKKMPGFENIKIPSRASTSRNTPDRIGDIQADALASIRLYKSLNGAIYKIEEQIAIQEQNGLDVSRSKKLLDELSQLKSTENENGVVRIRDWNKVGEKYNEVNLVEYAREQQGTKLFQEERVAYSKEPGVGEQLISKAVNVFGVTNDLREAGYILPDGRMLDFSGKNYNGTVYQKVGDKYISKQGQSDYLGKQRSNDHREIGQVVDKNLNENSSMHYFMVQSNAIRIDWISRSIDVTGVISPQQEKLLRLFDNATIDVTDPSTGDYVGNFELNGTKNIKKIINQINGYYKDGTPLPESGILFQTPDRPFQTAESSRVIDGVRFDIEENDSKINIYMTGQNTHTLIATTDSNSPVFQTVATSEGDVTILGHDDNGNTVYVLNGEVRTGAKPTEAVLAEPKAVNNPLGSTPSNLNHGDMLREISDSTLHDMFNAMEKNVQGQLSERPLKIDNGKLTPEDQLAIKGYLNQVKSDMAGTKLATMRYGEMNKDMALLNYQKRFGFDNLLGVVFPYQLWYTRTMQNWAMRAIDRPSWFAFYARMREMQRKQEQKGIPSRMRGKMQVMAPWLPDWAGGRVFVDPMRQLFPFDGIGQLFTNMQQTQSQQTQIAQQNLQTMLDRGEIGDADYQATLKNRTGYLWDKAMQQAQDEIDQEINNPVNMVTMMLSPAAYLDMPYKLLTGQGAKISPLPITRTASAIQTALKGTPIEEVGTLIGAAALPEKAIRKAAGISEFGEWGNYYVDRQLANMAADGSAKVEDVLKAMIDRTGPTYDEAYQRVQYEMAIKVPGVAPIEAVKSIANGNKQPLAAIGSSIFTTLFSQSLIPQGELIQRGLQQEYNAAWDAKAAGDSKAVTNFFTEHPEYSARLALWDTPEDRLRQFLVSTIWDQYTAAGGNKNIIRDQLGADFETNFLNQETADTSAIDINTLTYWAKTLGGSVPASVDSVPGGKLTGLMPQDQAASLQAYYDEKNKLFPNMSTKLSEYYNIQGTPQEAGFLRTFPEVQKYLDWDASYKMQNPQIDQLKQDAKPADERYRSQLVDSIWSQYQSLEGPNRWAAADELGKSFAKYFTNKDTRDYAAVDTATLEYWLNALGGELPAGGNNVPLFAQDQAGIKLPYSDEQAAAVQTYYDERTRQFPGIADIQTQYYNLGKDNNYLKDHPELRQYWDWKKKYTTANPLVKDYLDQQNAQYNSSTTYGGSRTTIEDSRQYVTQAELAQLQNVLISQLYGYYVTGDNLGSGAKQELQRVWEKQGKPGGTFENYIDVVLRAALMEGAVAQ